jgi:hypothetical protein
MESAAYSVYFFFLRSIFCIGKICLVKWGAMRKNIVPARARQCRVAMTAPLKRKNVGQLMLCVSLQLSFRGMVGAA